MDQPVYPTTRVIHSITLLLIYAYVKEELTFSFIYVLSPSLFVLCLQFYQYTKSSTGLQRAKYVITGIFMLCFILTLSKSIKDKGGMEGELDDEKWLVKHRRCF